MFYLPHSIDGAKYSTSYIVQIHFVQKGQRHETSQPPVKSVANRLLLNYSMSGNIVEISVVNRKDFYMH